MSNLSILPEDVRHEFEVKDDGRVVAKSLRAIGRLAGVSLSRLADVSKGYGILFDLKRLTENELPIPLKPFAGFDFEATESYPDVLVAGIIKYFAYHAKNPSETAQKVDSAMSAVGFRAFFQKELGWQPSPQSAFKLPTNYREALEMLIDVEKVKEKVTTSYPGLSEVYDSCGRDLLPVPELPANFKLAQWLSWKHIYLNLSDAISFGNFTASTVERDTGKRLSRQGRKIIYNQQHLPLLDECYKSWLQNRKTV